MNCTVDGCTRAVVGKGFCKLHYTRMRKGLAMDTPPRRIAAAVLWSADEDAVLERVYPGGGVKAVQAELPGRSRSSIISRAGQIGVSCDWARIAENAEPLTPVPRMDLLESLACVRLKNWRGPVNRSRALSPAIGVAA